jgi:hypothetical protein
MHLELTLRSATRWEGVYRCVDRSLVLRSGFESLFPNESVARRDLIDSLDKSTPEDFLADTYWNRLKVFNRVSIKTQADSVSTISQVVQWIGQLEDICASPNSDSIAVAAVRPKFASSLKSRVLPRIEVVNNTTMASVCDPRNAIVLTKFGTTLIQECFEAIAVEAENLYDGPEDEHDTFRKQIELDIGLASTRLQKLWDAQSEMTMEESWNIKAGGKKLRSIRDYIRMLMSVPCSGSQGDRNFSQAALDVRMHRNRLAVSTVEALAIICDMCLQPDFSFEMVLEKLLELAKQEE